MRHRKHRHKLSRPTGHRNALMRNLAAALIQYERIRTTEAKAKALRPYIERLVTLGKKGETHHYRQAFAKLQSKEAVKKLFTEIAPRFSDRPGGYTRITHDLKRAGDGAVMAYIEFVEDGAVAATASSSKEESDSSDS